MWQQVRRGVEPSAALKRKVAPPVHPAGAPWHCEKMRLLARSGWCGARSEIAEAGRYYAGFERPAGFRTLIHFFPRFAKDAEHLPFGQHLRDTGIPHRVFGAKVQQKYRHRYQLLLIGYPVLAWAAFVAACKSLYSQAGCRPDAVVISSDVEVLVFAAMRRLPGAARAKIIFIPFIFTQRAASWRNTLRLAYYRLVLRHVSCAICHSRLEVTRYETLFASSGTSFVFVPWGTHVPSAAEIAASGPQAAPARDTPMIVAAGKSGRDYATLAKAASAAGLPATVICNDAAATRDIADAGHIRILTRCFGVDYLWHLLHAEIVVVPLQVEDISAGQMVMIQAMSLAKPLVVTATPTIADYLQDDVNAVLVPRGDAYALATALSRLLSDPEHARRLGQRARADYVSRFSGTAHTNLLVTTIREQINKAHA
jgi:glycosyltransferase involved in cell wall biosynthesis